MESAEYTYSNQIWTPCQTVADGNCFFHALFGELQKKDGRECYFDKQATFRRHLWSTFLTFFENGDMTPLLVVRLHQCFFAIDYFSAKVPGNPKNLREYAELVSQDRHWVLVEEIPLLAALWNIKVVLFLNDSKPLLIFDPDKRLLGDFPFRTVNHVREAVIRLKNDHFEKLCVSESQSQELTMETCEFHASSDVAAHEIDAEIDAYEAAEKNYRKCGGSAGHHGSEYQVKILSMVLLASLRKLKNWKISTENEDAGNFDDFILEHVDGDVLVQIKHRQKDTANVIPYEALFSGRGDFSLPKYLHTFLEIKQKFKIRHVIICTNAVLQTEKKMENLVENHIVNQNHVLYFEGSPNRFFKFTEKAVEPLQKAAEVPQQHVQEFFEFLQFFDNFMTIESMNNVVKWLIPNIDLAEHLDDTATFESIYKIMLNWFNDIKPRYLLRLDAVAMFCDIRSFKYRETFKQYKITFKNDQNPLTSTNKQILHFIVSEEPILHLVKLHQTFRENNTPKVLFLNPDDNVSIQKQVVDVFSFNDCTVLVFVVSVSGVTDLMKRVEERLTRILTRSFKKVIFIAEAQNSYVRHITSSNSTRCEEFEDVIQFRDLTETSQNELSARNIVFQGVGITLKTLLGNHINDFVDTQTLAKLARNDLIQIGTELVHTDPNISSYYISRNLCRNDEAVPEEWFQDLDYLPTEKVVLVCDTAGMGKTTILTELAIRIKNAHPMLWVVRIDFNGCSSTFERAQNFSKSVTVQDLLEKQLTNSFQKKLFNKTDNVMLMLDAVDEVSPSYLTLITDMIKGAKAETNVRKVFVTTRPHLRGILENGLEVEAFGLQAFSKEDQQDFLKNYWSHELQIKDEGKKYKCEKYAETLIEEMSRWINDGAENSFAGIPLQTRMLAEVFQRNSKLDDDQTRQWQYCEEFLNSENEEPRLPKRINLIRLYELFVNAKSDEFLKKFPRDSITKQLLKETFEECHEFHYTLALAIVFFENECTFFSRYRESKKFKKSLVEDYVFRVGIVHEVDGSPTFIHRTFAEYFAAKCIVLELTEGPIKEGFCPFLLKHVLRRSEYHIIRLFFDAFIQDELLHISESSLNFFRHLDYMCILGNVNTTFLHLLTDDGLVGVIKFFFACIKFAVTGNRDSKSKVILVDCTNLELETPLFRACLQGHLNVIKILIEAGAKVNFQNAKGETVAYQAVVRGQFDLLKYLVEVAGADIHTIQNSYKESILHGAVRGGNLDIVKYLVKHRVNHKGLYCSALHLAVSNGRSHIVKYFIREAGIDVNVVDINKRTPLHIAASKRFFKAVRFLVRHSADVNAVDKAGNTPCHLSVAIGDVDTVRYLLDNGSDAEMVNEQGESPAGIMREWMELDEDEMDVDNS